jgi:hypothetical protein
MKNLLFAPRFGCARMVTAALLLAGVACAQLYGQAKPVPSRPGTVPKTDPNLANFWGLPGSSSSPWWMSVDRTGLRTPFGSDVCPTDAVFLALEDQVRGYPLRANGPTAPCQILEGLDTTLSTARSIAFGKHNDLHIAQFLSNSTFDIFSPNAFGDRAPLRSVALPENDLVSIAVDSRLNDFVMSIRQPTAPIFVVPNGSGGFVGNPAVISDPNLAQYLSLAFDRRDNLLVAGYDSHGAARVDALATSRGISHPAVLRSISGTNTGLLPGAGTFGSNNLTIALDPETDELYVYNTTADHAKIQVSVFAPQANGDIQPVRVIAGSSTTITGPGFPGANKIGVSSDGRLFVAEPNNRILVFAPGASGDVPPSQVIQDSTIGSQALGQGGIGVRSCSCR